MGNRFSFKTSQLGFPNSQLSAADAELTVIERSVGDYIREARKLSEEQIEQILAHQKEQGLRFGESAVALRLATPDDVIWALSQQFRYPYVPQTDGHKNPELVIAASPFSAEAETFRELRSRLLQGAMAKHETRRPLAVLSPDIGDGKTYTAANRFCWMRTCARRVCARCSVSRAAWPA
jgi:protein-tyrosine kinase